MPLRSVWFERSVATNVFCSSSTKLGRSGLYFQGHHCTDKGQFTWIVAANLRLANADSIVIDIDICHDSRIRGKSYNGFGKKDSDRFFSAVAQRTPIVVAGG